MTGNKNLNAGACFLPDAAFLAREKARADAECYTAMKVAEANKVLLYCCFLILCLEAGLLTLGYTEELSKKAVCLCLLVVSCPLSQRQRSYL